jgi:hypothetical protein
MTSVNSCQYHNPETGNAYGYYLHGIIKDGAYIYGSEANSTYIDRGNYPTNSAGHVGLYQWSNVGMLRNSNGALVNITIPLSAADTAIPGYRQITLCADGTFSSNGGTVHPSSGRITRCYPMFIQVKNRYNIESATCDAITGWAYKGEGSSARPARIHAYGYIGSTPGLPATDISTGSELDTNPADDPWQYNSDGTKDGTRKIRNDVASSFNLNSRGRYGFEWPIPDQLKDGNVWSVKMYYINNKNGYTNPLIKTLTIGPCEKPWSTTGTSQIAKGPNLSAAPTTGYSKLVTASPNEYVYFRHKIDATEGKPKMEEVFGWFRWRRSNEADPTSSNVNGGETPIVPSGVTYGLASDPDLILRVNKGGFALGHYYQLGNAGSSPENYKYQVTQDDVSLTKVYCQSLAWSPKSRPNTGGDGRSRACFRVPYNYIGCDATKTTCNPSPGTTPDPTTDCTQNGTCPGGKAKSGSGVTPTTSTDSSSAMVGDQIEFKYSLHNSGPTKTLPLEYRAYAFTLKSGQSISDVQDGPRVYPGNPGFNNVACGGRGVNIVQVKCVTTIISYGIPAELSPGPSYFVRNDGGQGSLTESSSTVGLRLTVGTDGPDPWDAQPGDKICSYLAVNNWSVIDNNIASTVAASNISCVSIVKKPALHLRGSDSVSGAKYWGTTTNTIGTSGSIGGFTGSSYNSSIPLNQVRGSFSQYSLITNGPIANLGSAGYTMTSLAGETGSGTIATGGNPCRLDFANIDGTGGNNMNRTTCGGSSTSTSGSSNLGKFTVNGSVDNNTRIISLPDVSKATTQSGATVNLNNLNTGTYKYTASNLTLSGTVKLGQHIVIYATGKVTVDSIDYATNSSGKYNNLGEVPSLVVYANGDIDVNHTVTTLYGVYIAGGTLNTCKGYTTGTTAAALSQSGACNQQLTINGALVTKNSPKFQRTFGSGNNNTTALNNTNSAMAPAEIVNYQPNLFLTPAYINGSGGNGLWQTVGQRGLPARW